MDPLEEARRLSRARRHAEAIPFYEQALAAAGSPGDRARILAELASEHQLAGRLADGIGIAEDALEMAQRASDEGVEAYAGLTLATLLLFQLQAGGPQSSLSRALPLLDRSAAIYLRQGQLDFAAAVFTMAEAALMVGESAMAEGLYQRVIAELADPRWLPHAAHRDELRARALTGLGHAALAGGDRKQAGTHYRAAAELYLARPTPALAPLLDELATLFESELRDRPLAARLRAAIG